MADPPMATGLVQYNVKSLCISADKKVSFSERHYAGMEIRMCERVVNWDGGGEIGCNDDIFGFDMYFPSRQVWLVLNVFKCHNDVGSFPLIVA
jgi:hypothetical protein